MHLFRYVLTLSQARLRTGPSASEGLAFLALIVLTFVLLCAPGHTILMYNQCCQVDSIPTNPSSLKCLSSPRSAPQESCSGQRHD
jgi:hypothetical protein